ncbi:unnamed protein product [Vicia faba]|uniref:Uncharacterized protein n=1 Tax=Vicia faba TaxID=3906 RepID=A0AAV0ZQ34_VICFA|nr:unnamed protein product [Vicia faba]
MYILNKKLQLLKGKLRIWNKEHFENVHHNVCSKHDFLKNIQDKIQLEGLNEILSFQENQAQADLKKALDVEEIFWHEKFILAWNLHEDKNTCYYHFLVKIKSARNIISHLVIEDTVIYDQIDIFNHVTSYFANLFGVVGTCTSFSNMENIIPNLVTEQMNLMLTASPYVEEIINAVFNLSADNSLGPDRFRCYFFQHY